MELRLINGSTGDPGLFIDSPGRDNALLFDAGDNKVTCDKILALTASTLIRANLRG